MPTMMWSWDWINPLAWISWGYRQSQAPVIQTGPAVSVGALSLGGAGKTPFSRFLAQRLWQKGVPVAVLLKSYRGATQLSFPVDGVSWSHLVTFGDEPLVMRRGLDAQIPIWAGPNKSELLKAFRHDYPNHLVILDDGAAHGPIRHMVQIFLINAAQFPWNQAMVPFGLNRLPVWDLKRAFQVVVTRVGQLDQPERFWAWVKKVVPPGVPIYTCEMFEIWPQTDRPLMAIAAFSGASAWVKKAQFYFGSQIKEVLILRNHQLPDQQSLAKVRSFLQRYSNGQLLLTEKDYVKWAHFVSPEQLAITELHVELEQEDSFWSDWAQNPILGSVVGAVATVFS